jgi:hypothetical protein
MTERAEAPRRSRLERAKINKSFAGERNKKTVLPHRSKTPGSNPMDLEKYVGRIVRLNKRAFEEIKSRAKRQGHALENCFLVAEVARGVHKLICYGANFRIIVGVSDVVMI